MKDTAVVAKAIEEKNTAMGIELGSTRIKAVLIGPDHSPIASGAFDWSNRLENGVWTYHLEDVWKGIQAAVAALTAQVKEKYQVVLRAPGALGVSAMMHGYLPLDAQGKLLAEFRTWRNTFTEEEAKELTALFSFNVPQRWSIAHLYRAVKQREAHVPQIAYLTTLAGYVHWMLTGEKVMGVGEAAGMFPVDRETGSFCENMVTLFDQAVSSQGLPWKLLQILPTVRSAGEEAGLLTPAGAKLLDPTGVLEAGVPMCPPEGDAGTGMVATNSVAVHTGNVSAGTSIFAMAVLEKPLSRVYPEIDMVATPAGVPVAMVHCNTCTSDLDAWVNLFDELLQGAGMALPKWKLYDLVYEKALEGQGDCDGIISYNFYSGEPVTGLEQGRPLLSRRPDSKLSLGNFMRAQLYATMATLKLGMDILVCKEQVKLRKLYGHGGLFKTKGVGQRLMAGALEVPVAVMETAGEGGPWGMAVLAMFRKQRQPGEALEDYLEKRVFCQAAGDCVEPLAEDVVGFASYCQAYQAGLPVARAAVTAWEPQI